MTLGEVNALPPDRFAERFGGVFEHSRWVAERAAAQRPFGSIDAMHAVMMAAVLAADEAQRVALLCAHPELAGREAVAGDLTADSTSEQGRLGFTALAPDEFRRIAEINRRYREQFGFPCIVALRLHETRASVIAEMERRTTNARDAEIAAALAQVGHITRGRLDKLVSP